MTLFAKAQGQEGAFSEAIDRYFDGNLTAIR